MNVIKDNIDPGKRKFTGRKPMVVKSTVIGNTLMPPPSSAVKKFVTPSSSRSRNKDGCHSSTSVSKSTPTVNRETHIIVSICEGRGKSSGIVGIAAVDIHRPVIILSQILDTQTYTATLTKLNILRPVEVLVPASFIEGATHSRIVTMIVAQFPNLTVNAIPRNEFNRGRGLQLLKGVCAGAFSSVILQIERKFYSLAASCALLRYVEQTRRITYSPKTVKVEYQQPEHTTAIDIDTANLLELASCSGKQNVSLFTVLNYCSTVPGKKLLRKNILQPSCRKDIIETRLDCVEELLENPDLLTRLQETLKPLSDIESSLTFATVLPSTASSLSERQLNYTLQLKGLLSAVQPLAEELKATKHPVFRFIYNRIEGLDTRQKILNLISEIINEDAHLAKGQAGELQRCFAIKSGINGFLDLSRRLYTEGVDAMRAYVDGLTEKHNLPLRVQHTIKSGFHIILPLTKALRNLKKTDLPPVFTRVERLSSHFYLTTMDMINFDKRLKNNSEEIQNISNVMIYQLLVSIRPYIGDLYNLCEDVAQLDMLVSLARASSLPNWVRPKIVDAYMNLEGVRQPILEHTSNQEPVANSIYAYPRQSLHILTGPNMSGKSILLHAISLTQILLQVGCYVPCTAAALRVCDRVYARVSDTEPQVTLQGSCFALEMDKMSYLLNTVGPTSLVVLDEMCRSTGCDEGLPMAMAICERLLKVRCFTFVATHYGALTVMEDLYPNIANWHLETLEEMRANNTRISLKFTYKLLPGITPVDCYGIKLSRIFNSSKSISDRAEDLYKYLLPSRKSLVSGNTKKSPEFLKYKLQSELDLLKIKNQLTDEIQKDKIENFQLKTGLSFQPSPLSIERCSADQPTSKRTTSSSSSDKQQIGIDSNNWVPTPKSNTISSNHEFSVPGSSKISERNTNKHIFSFDVNDLHKSNNSSFKYDELKSFNSADISLSSIHKNMSSENSNFFFNTEEKSTNIFFPEVRKQSLESDKQKSEVSSAKNTMFNRSLKSINFIVDSTPTNTENIDLNSETKEIKTVPEHLIENTMLNRSMNSESVQNISVNAIVQRLENSSSNFHSTVNTLYSKLPVTASAVNSSNSIINLDSCTDNPSKLSSDYHSSTSSSMLNIYSPIPQKLTRKTVSSSVSNTSSSISNERAPQSSSSMSSTFSPICNKKVPQECGSSTMLSVFPPIFNQKVPEETAFSPVFHVSSTILNKKLSKGSSSSILNNKMPEEIASSSMLNVSSTNLNKKVLPNASSSISNKFPPIWNKKMAEEIASSSMLNVSSTNLNEKVLSSVSSSIFNASSPILTKNRKMPKVLTDKNSIQNQIRLVSNLYDSQSESESESNDSDVIEIEEIQSDDSLILNKSNSKICSPDELNFSTYLNLRKGITSTPINSKDEDLNNSNTTMNTTQYFTSHSNENSVVDVQSPVKRPPSLPVQGTPRKLLKKSLLSSIQNSPSIFNSASFLSCENSSNFSTSVQVGQNVKKHPFAKDDEAFEQDTIVLD